MINNESDGFHTLMQKDNVNSIRVVKHCYHSKYP